MIFIFPEVIENAILRIAVRVTRSNGARRDLIGDVKIAQLPRRYGRAFLRAL